ncbi:lichenase [Dorcoceras hygrometricum]|uniref:Lichenase n=1 Tax=Dorcoceras hygrometricum TaxID=472368 RepID=A0A2Z7A335_9LAMI|nr:lichenase [Dorcoceras hygrometricum]
MSASGESSTTMHRLLHASGSHPIPPPNDPNQTMANSHTWIILIGLSVILCSRVADAKIGVCYGILGSNLPSPREVVSLCRRYGIGSVRVYNPNPGVLKALNGSKISVMVGVPNEDIPTIGQNPAAAQAWVKNNIRGFQDVKFKYIVVGNEINPLDPATASIAPFVVPAMQNIYAAVSGSSIKVSTAISTGILGKSYPPSAGAFWADISGYIGPVIHFLKRHNSPLLANIYTFLPYIGDPHHISLEYALFTSPSAFVVDGPYKYQNLFDATLDAIHVALEKFGAHYVDIVVSETGWPSAGGLGASVQNAKIFNTNLVKHVSAGTPRRPGKHIETYIFDLIDENQKSPEYERHWGLFLPNKYPKYPLTFS